MTDASLDASSASGVWALLGVRSDEVRAVRGLAGVSLLLGLALVAFYGSSNALFLTNYDIGVLPWVYIVNAAMVIVVGLLYSVASRRMALERVLVGSTVLIATSVLGLWLWATLSSGDVVSFFMAAWFRLLFIFAFLGLWEIASTIFDVRQAKRLFPAVALGAMVAFVVGGALTGVATAAIGATQMVLVSGLFFAVYAVGFARVLRVEMAATVPDSTPPAGPLDIIADRYSRLLAAMRSITILLIFVGEFIFYEQAAATFDDEESLATFLGVFIAASTLLMVIVTAAVAARYIAHFGMKIALITMPAGIGITALAAAVWGTFVGVDSMFFALVVCSMMANAVLSNAIETPVGAVMFQPLPSDRRMPVRVAVDGWLGSAALLVTGFLLLGFSAVDFDSVVPFTWLLGAVGLLGVWIAGRLYQGYKEALRSATTRAFSGDGALPLDLDDPNFDAIATGGPASAFAASSLLLANHDLATGERLIDSMLDHPDPLIVEAAISSGGTSLLPGVRRHQRLAVAVTRGDVSGAARGVALRSLAGLDSTHAKRLVHELRPIDDEALDEAAEAVLMMSADDRADATKRLRAKVSDGGSVERRSVARVLQHLDNDVPTDLAAALLRDDDPSVRGQALRSLEGKVTVDLTPVVLEAGRDPSMRRRAVLALAESDPAVLDRIAAQLNSLDVDYQAELIEHVYSQHTRRPALLHPFVEPGQPSRIRKAGFSAIAKTNIAPPASPERMLRDDIELVRELAAAWRDVSGSSLVMGWALETEFNGARSSIYRALSIDRDVSRIHDIEAVAANGTSEDRANAIEALDVMLRSELRRDVIPILEPATIEDAVTEFADLADRRPASQWLAELAHDKRLDPWTLATAQHHVASEAASTRHERVPMSALIERIVALKGVDIFSTLPYPLLAELAEGVREQRFDAGELIITSGALDHELYALTSGSVTVASAGQSLRLEAGTVVGELAVLDPAPRSADVVAATPCTVLVVRRDTLLALADRRPEVMVEIASVLARRLRSQSV